MSAILGCMCDKCSAERGEVVVLCPKCKGIGAPWNNSASIPCDECGGTGKVGRRHGGKTA